MWLGSRAGVRALGPGADGQHSGSTTGVNSARPARTRLGPQMASRGSRRAVPRGPCSWAVGGERGGRGRPERSRSEAFRSFRLLRRNPRIGGDSPQPTRVRSDGWSPNRHGCDSRVRHITDASSRHPNTLRRHLRKGAGNAHRRWDDARRPPGASSTKAGHPRTDDPALCLFRAWVRQSRTPTDAIGRSRSPCLRHRGRGHRRRPQPASPGGP
jgi:hypothetical protein